jgi:hypothetical protein
MVAGMVQGGGYGGHVGGIGIMSLIGAGITGASMASRMGAGNVVVAAMGGSAAKLMERVSVLDSSIGNGSISVPVHTNAVAVAVTPDVSPAVPDEPPRTQPISPDEQKGFSRPDGWFPGSDG